MQDLPQFIETLHGLVKEEQDERCRAIRDMGNFRLADRYLHHLTDIDHWTNISEEHRAKRTRKFLMDDGKSTQKTIISSDGKRTTEMTPTAGRSPQQVKRKRAESFRFLAMDTENEDPFMSEEDLPATQVVDDRILKESVRRELEQLGATVVKKLNQEHVSERMYPAIVPSLKGTPLLRTKLKKAKSMQPLDFEEELASSTERLKRKRTRLENMNKLLSNGDTPRNSPHMEILAFDTQPRSPKKVLMAREGQDGDGEESGPESVDDDIHRYASSINQTLNKSNQSSPDTSLHLLDSQEIASVVKTGVNCRAFGNAVDDVVKEIADVDSLTVGGDDNCDGEGDGTERTEAGLTKLKGKELLLNDIETANRSLIEDRVRNCYNFENDGSEFGSEKKRHNAQFCSTQNKKHVPYIDSDATDMSPIVCRVNGIGHIGKELKNISEKVRHSSVMKLHSNGHFDEIEGFGNISPVVARAKDKFVPNEGRTLCDTGDQEGLSDGAEVIHEEDKTAAKKNHKNARRKTKVDFDHTADHNQSGGESGKLQKNKQKSTETLSENMKPNRRKSRRLSIKQVMESLNETDSVGNIPGENCDRRDSGNDSTKISKEMDCDIERLNSSVKGQLLDDIIHSDRAHLLAQRGETMKKTFEDESKDKEVEDKEPKLTKYKENLEDHLEDTYENDVKAKGPKFTKSKSASDLACPEPGKRNSRSRRSVCVKGTGLANEEKTVQNSKDGVTKGMPQKGRKKKLMSLTDLSDQHSVLVDPKKSSDTDTSQLESCQENTGKGRKNMMNKKTDANETVISCESVYPNGTAQKGKRGGKRKSVDSSVEEADESSPSNDKPKRGRRKKAIKDSKAGAKDDVDDSKCNKTSGNKRYSSAKPDPGRTNKENKRKDVLVNDTHIEDDEDKRKSGNDSLQPGSITKIHDVTTQLNLTKDNSLVCSIRETTLSMSMSRAYNDSDVSTLLRNPRRSVDEFNLSRKQNKKQKVGKRSVLNTINEPDSNYSTASESDHSVGGGKRVRLNSSGKVIRPSLVMTNLHSHEQDVIISVVKKLGGFVISESVSDTTSHVICGEARRTLNVLQCLVRGLWLVTKEWVLLSLEAGRWIEEQEFEAHEIYPSCRVSRLERDRSPGFYRQSLFSLIGPVYISGRASPPRQHLVQFLKLAGGQVTGNRERASVYVGSDFHPGLTCVKPSWILDSITAHQQQPLDRYLLDRPKRESSPVY
ncbi:MCPH1-like protein [Mya arenaria]|uniref:MCPH1-like protein n=1 Tax=Mya arenaria TaxID=6604 RepID=A0ABY7FQX7_MYAAR|nr:MCPH1-like protein [Mya arenaria]